ncbi:MAG: hypothetical protein B6226_04215 [Candidatus Cloacimonetes bacterium 4572_65]|nr:MAG: hypothetical protein B6226_04215 [Candidatus Cloacimonetes bacterium 4572_65]
MFKKSLVIIALMALLVGTLTAGTMRKGKDCDSQMKGTQMRDGNRMGNDCGDMKGGMKGNNNHKRRGNKGGKGHKMIPGAMILRQAEELKLTDTQITNIKKLSMDFAKEANTKRAAIENLMIDKRVAMKAHNFSAVKKITKTVFAKKEALALEKINTCENIFKVLTKEQVKLMKENCSTKKCD